MTSSTTPDYSLVMPLISHILMTIAASESRSPIPHQSREVDVGSFVYEDAAIAIANGIRIKVCRRADMRVLKNAGALYRIKMDSD